MTKLEKTLTQFEKALARFKEAVNLPNTEIVRDAAIQRFEFTLDLSWKMVKAFLEDKKGVICKSPKDCFREAYRQEIIEYDEEWLKFVDLRNQTAHTYNEETAERIYNQLPNAVKYFESLLGSIKEEMEDENLE